MTGTADRRGRVTRAQRSREGPRPYPRRWKDGGPLSRPAVAGPGRLWLSAPAQSLWRYDYYLLGCVAQVTPTHPDSIGPSSAFRVTTSRPGAWRNVNLTAGPLRRVGALVIIQFIQVDPGPGQVSHVRVTGIPVAAVVLALAEFYKFHKITETMQERLQAVDRDQRLQRLDDPRHPASLLWNTAGLCLLWEACDENTYPS